MTKFSHPPVLQKSPRSEESRQGNAESGEKKLVHIETLSEQVLLLKEHGLKVAERFGPSSRGKAPEMYQGHIARLQVVLTALSEKDIEQEKLGWAKREFQRVSKDMNRLELRFGWSEEPSILHEIKVEGNTVDAGKKTSEEALPSGETDRKVPIRIEGSASSSGAFVSTATRGKLQTQAGVDSRGDPFVYAGYSGQQGSELNGFKWSVGGVSHVRAESVTLQPLLRAEGQMQKPLSKGSPFEVQAQGKITIGPQINEKGRWETGIDTLYKVAVANPATGTTPFSVSGDNQGIREIESFVQTKPIPLRANPLANQDLELQAYGGVRLSREFSFSKERSSGLTPALVLGGRFRGMEGRRISYSIDLDVAMTARGLAPSVQAAVNYKINKNTSLTAGYTFGSYERNPFGSFSDSIRFQEQRGAFIGISIRR